MERKEGFATSAFHMCTQTFVEGHISNSHWSYRLKLGGKVVCHLTHSLAVRHLIVFVCVHSATEKEEGLGDLSLAAQMCWSCNLIHPK